MIYKHGEPWWNDIDRGRTKNSEKNLSWCHLVHHKPPYGLTCAQTWASMMRHSGLTNLKGGSVSTDACRILKLYVVTDFFK
jgi:hypothetical protein